MSKINITLAVIRKDINVFWSLARRVKGSKTWMIMSVEVFDHVVSEDKYGHYYLDGHRMTLGNIARQLKVSEKAMKNIAAFGFCESIRKRYESPWDSGLSYVGQACWIEIVDPMTTRGAKLCHKFIVPFLDMQRARKHIGKGWKWPEKDYAEAIRAVEG